MEIFLLRMGVVVLLVVNGVALTFAVYYCCKFCALWKRASAANETRKTHDQS